MQNEERKPMGAAAKLGMYAIFLAAWLGLGFALYNAMPAFKEGGWGMWPILAVGLIFLFITAERTHYLFVKVKGDQHLLVARLQRHLLGGDVRAAVRECEATQRPLARIVGAGLVTLHRPDKEVQEAVDEAALRELPMLEVRTGYLAMIGNIATLLGLLGTIVGLITSFAGVSLENVNDPDTQRRAMGYIHLVPSCEGSSGPTLVACIKQNKATILAKGISEAMNCTAFGLLVGIMSLLAFSFLNGRTQNLLDGLNESIVGLMNLAVRHRGKMHIDTPGGTATGPA